jgi:hypothetical protein
MIICAKLCLEKPNVDMLATTNTSNWPFLFQGESLFVAINSNFVVTVLYYGSSLCNISTVVLFICASIPEPSV